MELEPCPFCGPRPELSGEWPQLFECSSAYLTEWSVRCGCCGIEIGDEDREETLRRWNTRVLPQREGVIDRDEVLEEAAKVAEGTAAYDDNLQKGSGCWTTGQRIAHVIRSLKGSTGGE